MEYWDQIKLLTKFSPGISWSNVLWLKENSYFSWLKVEMTLFDGYRGNREPHGQKQGRCS